MKKIIIGSRGSKLALIYANKVKNELSKFLIDYEDYQIEIKKIVTEGDEIQDKRLSDLGGKGLFSLRFVPKGDIVVALTGPVEDTPSRYSIEIGENLHIIDDTGKFMNHSFDPCCKIDGKNVDR